jgi:hypothetical protein
MMSPCKFCPELSCTQCNSTVIQRLDPRPVSMREIGQSGGKHLVHHCKGCHHEWVEWHSLFHDHCRRCGDDIKGKPFASRDSGLCGCQWY